MLQQERIQAPQLGKVVLEAEAALDHAQQLNFTIVEFAEMLAPGVDLIVVRVASMKHETPPEATLSPEEGLHGDRWTREWSWKRDVERQL